MIHLVTCPTCNQKFSPAYHYRHDGTKHEQIYCSRECLDSRLFVVGSKPHARAMKLAKLRACSECPTLFFPTRLNQRTCTPAHQAIRTRRGKAAQNRRARRNKRGSLVHGLHLGAGGAGATGT